jgi:hypothetical protein
MHFAVSQVIGSFPPADVAVGRICADRGRNVLCFWLLSSSEKSPKNLATIRIGQRRGLQAVSEPELRTVAPSIEINKGEKTPE